MPADKILVYGYLMGAAGTLYLIGAAVTFVVALFLWGYRTVVKQDKRCDFEEDAFVKTVLVTLFWPLVVSFYIISSPWYLGRSLATYIEDRKTLKLAEQLKRADLLAEIDK